MNPAVPRDEQKPVGARDVRVAPLADGDKGAKFVARGTSTTSKRLTGLQGCCCGSPAPREEERG